MEKNLIEEIIEFGLKNLEELSNETETTTNSLIIEKLSYVKICLQKIPLPALHPTKGFFFDKNTSLDLLDIIDIIEFVQKRKHFFVRSPLLEINVDYDRCI